MKKSTIVYFIIILCFFSCRSYQEAWLKPVNPLIKKLPKLDIFVDTINIENEMQYTKRYQGSFSNFFPIIRFNEPIRHVKSQSDELTMMNWSRSMPPKWYDEYYIDKNFSTLFSSISEGEKLMKYKEIPWHMVKFNEIPWKSLKNVTPWQLETLEGNLYYYRHYTEKFNKAKDSIKLREYWKLFPELIFSGYTSNGTRYEETIGLKRKYSTINNIVTVDEVRMIPANDGVKYSQPTLYTTIGELKNSIKKYPNFYWYKDSSFVKSVFRENDENVIFLGYFAKDYMFSVGDALDIFNNYFKDNIIDSTSISKGKIEIKIKKMKHTFNGLWLVSSLLTVSTINLLGYPLGSQTCYTKVIVTIKDVQGNVIKEYNEIGKGIAYSAAYWGYRWMGGMITKDDGYISNLSRIANTFAINNALNKIRLNIERDNQLINNSLK
jgi:hypothetical protein